MIVWIIFICYPPRICKQGRREKQRETVKKETENKKIRNSWRVPYFLFLEKHVR